MTGTLLILHPLVLHHRDASICVYILAFVRACLECAWDGNPQAEVQSSPPRYTASYMRPLSRRNFIRLSHCSESNTVGTKQESQRRWTCFSAYFRQCVCGKSVRQWNSDILETGLKLMQWLDREHWVTSAGSLEVTSTDVKLLSTRPVNWSRKGCVIDMLGLALRNNPQLLSVLRVLSSLTADGQCVCTARLWIALATSSNLHFKFHFISSNDD